MRKFFLNTVLLSLLLLFSANCAFMQNPVTVTTAKWNPQRTWVFFAGLLEWEDSKNLASFPQKNRRDQVWLDELRKRGVPETQIVYLKDGQGTTARIQAELIK